MDTPRPSDEKANAGGAARPGRPQGNTAAFPAFCLFCGAKQAKTSPVRRLSTLYSIFLVLEPQNLVSFNGAGKGVAFFLSFAAGVSKKRHSRNGFGLGEPACGIPGMKPGGFVSNRTAGCE